MLEGFIGQNLGIRDRGVLVVMSLGIPIHPKSAARGGPTIMADVDNQPEVRHHSRLQDVHVSASRAIFW